MKAYIITSGEYSDYGIECVFSDKAAAEKFCAIHNTGNKYGYPYEIEEYEMDEVKIEGEIKVYYKYVFIIEKSGWINHPDFSYVTSSTPAEIKELIGGRYSVTITLDEDNTERAKKIACDKLAEYKAEKLLLEF